MSDIEVYVKGVSMKNTVHPPMDEDPKSGDVK